jgi:hypothetical protein
MAEQETPKVWDNGTAPHSSLAEALAAFQAEVPKMSKDETAKVKSEKANYTYGYAGLDQFVEIVEPALGKHGLAVTSRTTFTPEGVFMLEVTLLHEMGERETAYWPLPDPRRMGPQDIGSAMTYGRRYLGWGLTGTFPGGIDDDGKQAQATARESWDNAKPVRVTEPAPAAEPAKPVKTSWTDDEVADYQAKLTQVDLTAVGKAYDWMASRDLHNRGVGPSGKTATLVLALRLADTALQPQATPEEIAALKAIGETRGLMKVKVSAAETLEEALFTARELAQHAADAEGSQETTPEDTAYDSADVQ